MQAVKVILAVFLSILLFATLSVVGVIVTLNQTVLNADFVVRQVDRLDISAAVAEILDEDMVASLVGDELPIGTDFLVPILLDTLEQEEAWVKEQAAAAINEVYSYILGQGDSLRFDVSLVDVRDTLETNLIAALSDELPPELLELVPQLAQLPPDQRQALVEETIPTLMTQIPESVAVDLADISPSAVTALTQTRGYLGYFTVALWGSIGLAVFLALLIVLVFRSVRGAGITLGVVFVLYGALMLVVRFAADITLLPILSPYLMMTEMSPQLTQWAIALVYEVLAPALWLGVGFATAGVILIVGGALARRRDEY